MNVKRLLLAALAVFVSLQLMDFVVHMKMLTDEYMALSSVWNPNMMDMMWVMYITGAIFSLLFVCIYVRGYHGKGIKGGLWYGFIMGVLIAGIGGFNQFVIYPVTLSLAVKWFIFGTFEFMIAGLITSLIYKPKEAKQD